MDGLLSLAETAAIIVTIPIWGYVMHMLTRLQTGFGLIAALHASSYIDNDVVWMVIARIARGRTVMGDGIIVNNLGSWCLH